MSYIVWLGLFVWLPTVFLWIHYHHILKKYKRTIVYAIFFALLFVIPWDTLAVGDAIWIFPKGGTLGIYIGVLPLEEYLFIATVTLFVSSMTLVFKYVK